MTKEAIERVGPIILTQLEVAVDDGLDGQDFFIQNYYPMSLD